MVFRLRGIRGVLWQTASVHNWLVGTVVLTLYCRSGEQVFLASETVTFLVAEAYKSMRRRLMAGMLRDLALNFDQLMLFHFLIFCWPGGINVIH